MCSSSVNAMFAVDPMPWLMQQEGLAAVRGRRLLECSGKGDSQVVEQMLGEIRSDQRSDGSIGGSVMGTAATLALLADLQALSQADLVTPAAEFLFRVLTSQPGYEAARTVKPGKLRGACDLCGFFGPYSERQDPDRLKQGACEMNAYRELEPLTAPTKPVRWEQRSALDRVGPSSCYAWGFMPLAYTVEALCKAGYANDPRLEPGVNVLLGTQRAGGGWCRNWKGHARCTLHGLRAVGAHPRLRGSDYADAAIAFAGEATRLPHVYAYLQALSVFDRVAAREIMVAKLDEVASRQRRNGTFGTPCRTEKVVAVLLALRALD